MKNHKDTVDQYKIKQHFFESKFSKIAIVTGLMALVVLIFVIINFNFSLSHVNIKIFSGSQTGNYYALALKVKKTIHKNNGVVKNTITNGTLDNLKKLVDGKGSNLFGFAQNWNYEPYAKKLELIAHLTISEGVYFLAKNAKKYKRFRDLHNKTVGVGPKGSGTDKLCRQIFKVHGFSELHVKVRNYSIEQQIKMLTQGTLDVGVFVIAKDSRLIKKAILEQKLHILSFKNLGSIAYHLPFMSIGKIESGYYNPVKNIPPYDIPLLTVDTLIVAKKKAKRSQVIGLLYACGEVFPGFLSHNKNKKNFSGLPMSEVAKEYYSENGMGIMDRYSPRIADVIPLGNIVQLGLAISILFNIMGFTHRFRLWRIDAVRFALESKIYDIFGKPILLDEMDEMNREEHVVSEEQFAAIQTLISEFEALRERCRNYSVSMVVPMGQEMAYRYQEGIIQRRMASLKLFIAG